jgi:hypothetical protein
MSDSDTNSDTTRILDDLLSTLEIKLAARPAQARTDAITAILNQDPRRTGVVSLHSTPAVEAFRQALTDGLIRVDTANRLLRLINEVVVRLVP